MKEKKQFNSKGKKSAICDCILYTHAFSIEGPGDSIVHLKLQQQSTNKRTTMEVKDDEENQF